MTKSLLSLLPFLAACSSGAVSPAGSVSSSSQSAGSGGAGQGGALAAGGAGGIGGAGGAPACEVKNPIPATFFGMHAQKVIDKTSPIPWPSASFGSLRLWSIPDWAQIDGKPGNDSYGALDLMLTMASQHGVADVMFTIGHTPVWASSNPTDMNCVKAFNPGGCDPPDDLAPDGSGTDQHFKDFVTALAAHAGKGLAYWESWNEAGAPAQWTGTDAQLVRMTEDMHDIVKAANPEAMIVSPPFNGGDKKITASMDGFFGAGGGQYVDVIAFHGYLGAYGVPSVAENILHITQAVKAKAAEYGLAGKPIFDTEGSWGPNEDLTGDDARAAFVARYYLLHASEGISRMYWFSWGDYDYGELFSTAKGLEPAGVAYGVVESWLVGASMSPCTVDASVVSCDLARPEGMARAIWKADGPGTTLVTAQFTAYEDLTGTKQTIGVDGNVAIGPSPILLLSSACAP